jgi:hypothetical protein
MLGDVGGLRRLVREAGGQQVVRRERGRIASEISQIVQRNLNDPLEVSGNDRERISGLLSRLEQDARGFDAQDVDPNVPTRMKETVEQLQRELTVLRRSSLLPT